MIVIENTIRRWATSKGILGHKVDFLWKFKSQDVDAWARWRHIFLLRRRN